MAVRAAPSKLGPSGLVVLGLLPSIPFHSQSHFLAPVPVWVAVSVYVWVFCL